ncbi:MAG: hypothetical protein U0470_11870 [Anaerolineae bacterium]
MMFGRSRRTVQPTRIPCAELSWTEAVDAAARAKAAGVTFFMIGLGDDVDDGALEAIAAPGGR